MSKFSKALEAAGHALDYYQRITETDETWTEEQGIAVEIGMDGVLSIEVLHCGGSAIAAFDLTSLDLQKSEIEEQVDNLRRCARDADPF